MLLPTSELLPKPSGQRAVLRLPAAVLAALLPGGEGCGGSSAGASLRPRYPLPFAGKPPGAAAMPSPSCSSAGPLRCSHVRRAMSVPACGGTWPERQCGQGYLGLLSCAPRSPGLVELLVFATSPSHGQRNALGDLRLVGCQNDGGLRTFAWRGGARLRMDNAAFSPRRPMESTCLCGPAITPLLARCVG